MRFMVLVKANKDSEAGVLPSQEILEAMGKFNEELAKAGVVLAAEGLHPSSKGVRVRFHGKERVVIDGPFPETKELVAGFWLWKCDSLAEAVDWIKRSPFQQEEVEIRQVYSADDLGEAFTPQLREQEASIRAGALGLGAVRFEDGRELVIAGLNETYTLQTREKIPAQWERFAPHIGNVAGQVGQDAYGVSWNHKPGIGFDYLAGVEVSDPAKAPAEFAHVRLPARRYAVFTHEDHVSTMPKAFDTIWTSWAPECGFKLAHAPCFERYTPEFNPMTGKGGMEIWIPLES